MRGLLRYELSAQRFYSACLARKLSEKDIELYSLFLYNDGMTINLCMRKKVAGNKTGKWDETDFIRTIA